MCMVGSHCVNGMWGIIKVEPVPPPNNNNNNNNTTDVNTPNETKNSGKLVGVVIGGILLGLVIVSVLGFFAFRRYRFKQTLKRLVPEEIKKVGQKTENTDQDTKDKVTTAVV